MTMLFEKFVCPPFDTNCYLIGIDELCAIDPGQGAAKQIIALLEKAGKSLTKILLTHSHWDHIVDVKALKEATGAEIFIHELDHANLEKPGSDRLPLMIKIDGVKADHFVQDGEKISVQGLSFTVIHTPGHSPGGVAFYEEKQKLLFSGDTLFQGTMGNISFPTSDPEKMFASLEKLGKLPGDTRVFPGHGPETLIDNERWVSRAKELYGG